MEKIKTILIEDEPLPRQYLQSLASKNIALEIIGVFESPIDAKDMVLSNSVDLILSDIQMPQMDGVSFLKSLENPPLFVFITAHPEFAVDGFDLDVVDYILKPTLTQERLTKAIAKVKIGMIYRNGDVRQEVLKFKDGPRTVFLHPTDILFIKSCGDYVKVTTSEETIMVKTTLKALEDDLPKDSFVRIHRSHMIHIGQIKSVDAVRVKLKNGEKFDIGLQYREQLYKKMGMKVT